MAKKKSYKNVWLSACFGPWPAALIDVKFRHHAETDSFPADSLENLKLDPAVEWITSNETGEILFSRD